MVWSSPGGSPVSRSCRALCSACWNSSTSRRMSAIFGFVRTIDLPCNRQSMTVNMAAAGLYTIGGSFWEFGEADWERTKYFIMFGVAEDHDSNPIKIGLGKLKGRGAKFVSVNPVRTGYSAIADEWIGVRPGTDGMLVLALVHELPQRILEWRALQKLKSTYIDALPLLVHPETGRLHTSFNQAIAATGCGAV